MADMSCCHACPLRTVGMGHFSLIRRIGTGTYGEVHAARKEDTLGLFALKVVKIPRATKLKAIKHLNLEREALELVSRHRCPNITGLDYAFRYGDTWLVLAMPLMSGGVLQTHLEERAEGAGGFPLAEVRWIGAQLTLALEALHRVGFVHRDIKPTNVVLRHDGHWFLTDLGLCARVEPPTSGRAGTRGYWAPETIERRPQVRGDGLHTRGVRCVCLVRCACCVRCTVLHCAALCCTLLPRATLCCPVLHSAAPCCPVLPCAALCCPELHAAALCCARCESALCAVRPAATAA